MGTGGQGGGTLSAIVAKLQQAGFGDQVKSWIGTGQNLPITADQLKQVLGSDVVRQLAAKYNIPIDQVAEVLAHQLPRGGRQGQPRRQTAAHGLSGSGLKKTTVGDARRTGPNRENQPIGLKYQSEFAHLPCPDVTGQGSSARAIDPTGFSAGFAQWDRQRDRRLSVCDGEGVEAQISRRIDRLLYREQRFATGRDAAPMR